MRRKFKMIFILYQSQFFFIRQENHKTRKVCLNTRPEIYNHFDVATGALRSSRYQMFTFLFQHCNNNNKIQCIKIILFSNGKSKNKWKLIRNG
jgi:hypothetical protein